MQSLTRVGFYDNLKIRKGIKEGDGLMLKEIIERLREKLDNLILTNAPYDEVYKVSRELDKYIAEYYREEVRLK